jgi:hypothetical protein
MHPRWNVWAFDFEDRTRATLPADARVMRFLKTDILLVELIVFRGSHFTLIHDQAVDAITRAGREPQRRYPEDRARGRGYPMSKWAIVFNHSDGEFWVYPSPHPLYGELRLGNELTALENIKLYQKKVRTLQSGTRLTGTQLCRPPGR